MAQFDKKTVTIPAGATGLSAVFDLPANTKPVGLFIPNPWVAADLSFQAFGDDQMGATVGYNVYDASGVEMTIEATAHTSGAYIMLTENDWPRGSRYLKLRSGVDGAPVNQTASRTITIVLMPAPGPI